MHEIWKMFGISLLLTLVLELVIAACFGYKDKKLLILVILVNVLTNPVAVLLHWLGIAQIPIELAVVLVESYIYRWFSKDEKWNIPHPVLFAVVANGLSWGLGVWIQWIGG